MLTPSGIWHSCMATAPVVPPPPKEVISNPALFTKVLLSGLLGPSLLCFIGSCYSHSLGCLVTGCALVPGIPVNEMH